jgi:cytochrome c biogenesis protein CcmG/thiol:disulfide interchange protein DsbE
MKIRSGIIPLLLFILIGGILWIGLRAHPELIPSPLINKPAPAFSLPVLRFENKVATEKDFIGHVTFLNVWASWCPTCAEEHSQLLSIAKDQPDLVMYGLDYKDDAKDARKYLHDRGNPFKTVAVDTAGSVAIDYGVYGTPETFIIDKKGIIRFKYIGSITDDVWQGTLRPLIIKLEGEST